MSAEEAAVTGFLRLRLRELAQKAAEPAKVLETYNWKQRTLAIRERSRAG